MENLLNMNNFSTGFLLSLFVLSLNICSKGHDYKGNHTETKHAPKSS